jgi:hypothetical protein
MQYKNKERKGLSDRQFLALALLMLFFAFLAAIGGIR